MHLLIYGATLLTLSAGVLSAPVPTDQADQGLLPPLTGKIIVPVPAPVAAEYDAIWQTVSNAYDKMHPPTPEAEQDEPGRVKKVIDFFKNKLGGLFGAGHAH